MLRLRTNAFKFKTQHISTVPNLVYVLFQRNKERIMISLGLEFTHVTNYEL